MKVVAVIPARYESKRLRGKPLLKLNKKPIIQWVYEAAISTELFDEVIVATDDKKIYNFVVSIGGNVRMTNKNHKSGTDRIAEVVQDIDADIIVNVQGDQPFVTKQLLKKLISPFMKSGKPQMSTIACTLDQLEIDNPNTVKVVTDLNDRALYFSRSMIPYVRFENKQANYYAHIGLYAYRKDFLLKLTKLKQTPLESVEGLEQLRVLENGYDIVVNYVPDNIIEINTKRDLEMAEKFLKNN